MFVVIPLEGAETAVAGFPQFLFHEVATIYCLPVEEIDRKDLVFSNLFQSEYHKGPLSVDVCAIRQAFMLKCV